MRAEPVLVALPGTMCSPAVFEPLARALTGRVILDPFSWLTQPGPWDIPAIAERVAAYIGERWGRPVLVLGHSTGGAIALQLALREPQAVLGLVLVDTGAHMRGHGDVDAILDLTGDLTGITRPVIVVHGRHDRARPPEQGRELAQSLPDAEFRLADAGHTPVYETPDVVAAAVLDVLHRTTVATDGDHA
jgi:3-oxoadipate enol-lactonase